MGDLARQGRHAADQRTGDTRSPGDPFFNRDIPRLDDEAPSDEVVEVPVVDEDVTEGEHIESVPTATRTKGTPPPHEKDPRVTDSAASDSNDERTNEPDISGNSAGNANREAVLKEGIDDAKEGIEDVEAQEQKYLAARDRLVRETKELRAKVIALNEQVMRGALTKKEFKDEADKEVKELAGRFTHEERMLVLKKALKDVHIPHEDTARMKFEFLVGLSLKMKYWDRENYLNTWDKKAGKVIETGFEEDRESFSEHLVELESYYEQIAMETQETESQKAA